MKFHGKSPCTGCPYRKDAPVAKWDRSEFERLLALDSDVFTNAYACHRKDDTVCRGYLMDQLDRGLPNLVLQVLLLKHQVPVEYLNGLTCRSDRYPSVAAMAEANYPGICCPSTRLPDDPFL